VTISNLSTFGMFQQVVKDGDDVGCLQSKKSGNFGGKITCSLDRAGGETAVLSELRHREMQMTGNSF